MTFLKKKKIKGGSWGGGRGIFNNSFDGFAKGKIVYNDKLFYLN